MESITTNSGGRQRRLHMAADQERYGSRSERRQEVLQKAMRIAIDTAAREANLDQLSWERQPGGDSELVVFPADTDDARVIADLIRELDTALGEFNACLRPDERLRLRVALTCGFSTRSDLGWAGEAPVRAARLVDAKVTREALTRTEDTNLVVIIDGRLFHEVVEEGLRGLRPGLWASVRARAKNFDETAYLYVPHYSSMPGSDRSRTFGNRNGIRRFYTTTKRGSKPHRTALRARRNGALIAAAVIGVSSLATAVVAAVSALIDGPQSAGSYGNNALLPTVSPSPAATSRLHADTKRRGHSKGHPGPAGPSSSAPDLSRPVSAPPNPSHPHERHTPRPSTPPPSTYAETVGGTTHTWSDYADAGGSQGETIAPYKTVQISCRVRGFAVQDGNTWWYQIASTPWNNNYYASADAFYNNGRTAGSLVGTPYYDPSVPGC